MVKKRILKRMGYLADQQGIINRYLREAGGWDSHLLKCREYIIEKVSKYKPGIITILGSGWLLDVPLEELSGMCNTINLVDISHPPQIRKKAGELQNVILIDEDITGGLIENTWKASKRGINNLEVLDIPEYTPSFEPGLVISLNILTQTDTLVVDYLLRQLDPGQDQLKNFRKKIQSAHINFLKKHDSLLISDYHEIVYDKEEVFRESKLIFCDLPESAASEKWDWDFDNAGEYYRRKRIVFKVIAIDNVRKK